MIVVTARRSISEPRSASDVCVPLWRADRARSMHQSPHSRQSRRPAAAQSAVHRPLPARLPYPVPFGQARWPVPRRVHARLHATGWEIWAKSGWHRPPSVARPPLPSHYARPGCEARNVAARLDYARPARPETALTQRGSRPAAGATLSGQFDQTARVAPRRATNSGGKSRLPRAATAQVRAIEPRPSVRRSSSTIGAQAGGGDALTLL